MPMKNLIDTAQEWKGRLIAYLGGSGVTAISTQTNAAINSSIDAAVSVPPEITLTTWISLGGLIVIAGRLVFDVWCYFDKRRHCSKKV